MKLFTKAQMKQLLANGAKEEAEDLKPVVKLFNPTGAGTWLISWIDPNDPDCAFGLCDLGHGSAELGMMYLPEMIEYRGPFGLGIERDRGFKPTKTLYEYAKDANEAGRITC